MVAGGNKMNIWMKKCVFTIFICMSAVPCFAAEHGEDNPIQLSNKENFFNGALRGIYFSALGLGAGVVGVGFATNFSKDKLVSYAPYPGLLGAAYSSFEALKHLLQETLPDAPTVNHEKAFRFGQLASSVLSFAVMVSFEKLFGTVAPAKTK